MLISFIGFLQSAPSVSCEIVLRQKPGLTVKNTVTYALSVIKGDFAAFGHITFVRLPLMFFSMLSLCI